MAQRDPIAEANYRICLAWKRDGRAAAIKMAAGRFSDEEIVTRLDGFLAEGSPS